MLVSHSAPSKYIGTYKRLIDDQRNEPKARQTRTIYKSKKSHQENTMWFDGNMHNQSKISSFFNALVNPIDVVRKL